MKVLIIDDEYLIRKGLETSIDWHSLGFDSVSTAEDGMEALALIELAPPDLILTDVRMPFMTGLEFAERVKQIVPDVCIVIISGHDEFTYAQTAVKLAVFDYILKPINLKEITEVILRAKAWIDQKRKWRENVYYEQIFNKPIEGSGSALFCQEALKEAPDAIADCDVRGFRNALLYGSREEILNEYEKLKTRFRKKKSVPRILLQLVCSNLFFECKHAVEEQGGELEAIMESPVLVFREMITQPSIGHMFEHLSPALISMLDYRDTLSSDQFTQEIENAKKYMSQNYSDIELNLNSVAKYVNMSPCYFSVIFKKATGITFINYLTGLRIAKAKELLLNSNMKSYEISFEVGYDNPTYFSTVFKKITGCTPIDFKKAQLSHCD